MANKKIWLGMLVLVLVFGMMIVGCDNGSTNGGGNTSPKTLVITNIPNSVYSEIRSAGSNAGLSLFNVGTTLQQMTSYIGFAAGAYLDNSDINVINNSTGFVTVTIPLRNIDNSRWTGSGTYDVLIIPDIENTGTTSGTIYKASSINFSTEITSVHYNDFTVFSQ